MSENYSATAIPVSDDESKLITSAKSNDEEAFGILYKRYLPTIYWYVKSLSPPYSEKDDLVQEGVIGFIKAIRTYDKTYASFRTYASLCVKRSIISALRKYKRQSGFALPVERTLPPEAIFPETEVIEREAGRLRYNEFIKSLSEFERQTLTLYLSGMSYADMADKLNCSQKSIDNAITRTKLKIKRQSKNSL